MNDADREWAEANLKSFTSFDDFVKRWLSASNIQTYIHFTPQYKFLCLPKRNEIQVDFLGFFENIEQDFYYVSKKLSINENISIKHENKTEQNREQVDYKEFYTDESRDIVSEVYKKDISLFGYNFDNSSLETQLKKRCT